MGLFKTIVYHKALAQPGVSLLFTALSLLLLVLVLLSVPGPIKGLYWFSVPGEISGEGELKAGVLGWCATDTSNCTYAPLSDDKYLSTLIDTGEALTVRIMLPLACYWSIITLILWVALSALTPLGYKIKDLDSITRHLRFAVIEACVFCVTLFGNVLCWLAFGLGRAAFMTVRSGGGEPKSGRAMETTAVAAMLSLFSLFTAIWGLHLRLRSAQSQWKEEAVMVRRRSMALSAAGGGGGLNVAEGGRASTASLGYNSDIKSGGNGSQRWSDVPDYPVASGFAKRASMVKIMGDEERLEEELERARRNSRDQEMVRRASMLSPHSTPYAAAQSASNLPNKE